MNSSAASTTSRARPWKSYPAYHFADLSLLLLYVVRQQIIGALSAMLSVTAPLEIHDRIMIGCAVGPEDAY